MSKVPFLLDVFTERIQEKVDMCIATSQIGKIPHKISSTFARLTTNQWKNWTPLFSLLTLYGTLPEQHRVLAAVC